ncbi:MAG: hypothetical protein AAF587_24665 [Bacteroidota bacterium]
MTFFEKTFCLFVVCSVQLSSSVFGQIDYRPGYYIDQKNERIACFIRDAEWEKNPSFIWIKHSEEGTREKKTIEDVREFGSEREIKYIRETVQIDTTDDRLSKLSSHSQGGYVEQIVFLKVLVSGEASLFLYQTRAFKRFFYQMKEQEIRPLVYRRYLDGDQRSVLKNNQYQNELWLNLNCNRAPMRAFENLRYSESSLVKSFQRYNDCRSETYVDYYSKKTKDILNVSIRPGINYSVMNTSIPNVPQMQDTTFRLGVEAEISLPFRRKKWAILLEPTYQSIQRRMISRQTGEEVGYLDYHSIDLPIGLRHSFFIGENSRIFVNGSLMLFSFTLRGNLLVPTLVEVQDAFTSSTRWVTRPLETHVVSSMTPSFGVGYGLYDRFALEFRYHMNRAVDRHLLGSTTRYTTIGFILSYTIL